MAKIVTDQLILAADAASKRSYESGTSWYDLSSSNLTGTLTNGPTSSSLNGGYIQLDGTNDYVDFGNDVTTPALPFSVSCWVRFDAVDANDPIFDSSYDASSYYGFWVQKATDNLIKCHYGDGTGGGTADRRGKYGTTTLVADTWYHISCVWRGATDMSIYINGVDDGGTHDGSGGALAYGSSKPARIGVVKSNYAGIKIPQLLVYSKGLTKDEVLQNYYATRGRFV
jgi:hypothetical protein